MFRQGDVLLIPTDEDVKVGECLCSGECILAHGEVTGHAHRVRGKVKLFTIPGSAERLLKVAARAKVVHEEHGTLTLPRGHYRILIQKEYSPEAIRSVAD